MRKNVLYAAIVFVVLFITACGNQNISASNMFMAENKEYTIGQSTYSDFSKDGWNSGVDIKDVAVYQVTIKEKIHYEYSIALSKNSTTISEAIFKSEDASKDLTDWVLSAIHVSYKNETNAEAKITYPLQVTPFMTEKEITDLFTTNYRSIYKTTNQSNTDYEIGIVDEKMYVGAKYDEDGGFLSLCIEINEDFNEGRSATRYEIAVETTEETEFETETRPSFAVIEERQCFTYQGNTYIVGKNTLGDFLEDGWNMEGEYSPNTSVPPKSVYEVTYLTKDNIVINRTCFVNSSPTEYKLLEDCTMISCCIPLGLNLDREYDNSDITLPHGLDKAMNYEEAVAQLDKVSDIPSHVYEDNECFLIRMGIVSPYNVDVGFFNDKITMSHIYMEVNIFYAEYY